MASIFVARAKLPYFTEHAHHTINTNVYELWGWLKGILLHRINCKFVLPLNRVLRTRFFFYFKMYERYNFLLFIHLLNRTFQIVDCFWAQCNETRDFSNEKYYIFLYIVHFLYTVESILILYERDIRRIENDESIFCLFLLYTYLFYFVFMNSMNIIEWVDIA